MRSYRKGFRFAVLAVVATVVLAGCGKDDDKSASDSSDTTVAKGSLTIAGSDFVEQDIVSNIYAVALRAKGYTVTVKPHLGKREVVQPALQSGEVDVLPEYVGSLLEYVQKGSATPDLAASVAKLRELLKPKNLTALEAAPAYDANALVVTKATADKYKLEKASDLTAVASQLTWGGPPECPTRPLCAIGYKDKYGLNFKSFKALDSGGPITKKALTDGDVDVALLFSSDVPENTVILKDDKSLQPAENLIPVLRTEKATADVTKILNAVSEKLTLEELVDLNHKASGADKPDPATLANDWAKEYKLA
jgi:osmoprotectant transport system substrate-binding protein